MYLFTFRSWMKMGHDDMNTDEIPEEQLPVLELPDGVSEHDIAMVILSY